MPGPPEARFEREALVLARVTRGQGSFEERTGRLLWRTRGRPHHDAFTDRALGFLSVLFFFIVLNLMDMATTIYGVTRLGWEAEGNPVLRLIGTRYGEFAFAAYKAFGTVVVVSGLWLMHRGFSRAVSVARSRRPRRVYGAWRVTVEAVALGLVVVFTFVVVNNLVLIVRS